LDLKLDLKTAQSTLTVALELAYYLWSAPSMVPLWVYALGLWSDPLLELNLRA
jgi:hypothetical protein